VPREERARAFGWDPFSGSHQGQQPKRLHSKAEYMAAPERFAELSDSPCNAGAVHTWHEADVPRCPTSLIGRLGSSAFRLSTTTTSRSLAGYALLFGIGTKALPSWDPRTRWNNLRCDLASRWRQDQSDMRTHLIHRPARDTIPLRSGVRVTACDLSWLWLSCCCSCLSRPSELGAIHPDAVHDHR
jgi:hypothetical protein